MESFDEIEWKKEYLFFIIVEKSFAITIKDKFKNFLKKLTLDVNGDANFVPVKLSPTGERPATHFAMRMQVRGREAKKIAIYASNATPTNIFTWMLTPFGKVLWTRNNGFGPFTPDPWIFKSFISEDPINLQIIE